MLYKANFNPRDLGYTKLTPQKLNYLINQNDDKKTMQYMFNSEYANSQEKEFADYIGMRGFRHVDRSNTSNLHYKIYSPIPEKKHTELIPCIEKQANRIKSLQHRDLFLLWSGGIDSTTVFYSLLDADVKFTIVFDDASFEEYPWLAEQILQNKFPNVKSIFNVNNLGFKLVDQANKSNTMFITGDPGDNLMASTYVDNLNYQQRQTLMKNAVEKNIIPENIWDYAKDSVGKVLEVDPNNLTVSEFCWALNFIFKYQTVTLRIAVHNMRTTGSDYNTIHFFDTPEFQQYAMTYYKENCDFVDPRFSKRMLKNYIFQHNGDTNYRDYKCKIPSLLRNNYM